MKANVKAYIENRFEKIKLLRRSDKGEVHLAQVRDGGEFVIIKYVKLIGLPYKILQKNFNPLFAKILTCAEDSKDTVIVEEFIQGEPLIERLRQKNFLTEEETLKILLQLCDGLKFLHGLGIIHRDIKPSNLILQTGGVIRLIDFDAARIFKENQAQYTKSLGTKGYAAPEQFGYRQTDSRSDIYALGVTLLELSCENCGERLKKILAKCTAFDPKDRYQSVDELKAALISEPKRRVNKKFLLTPIFIIGAALTLYNIFRANPTENLPVVEEITAPVEVEEPPKVEVKPPIKNPADEKFTFPEITLPQNTTPINPPAPIEPLPTEIELPKVEPAPPADDYKTPQPFQKENSMTNANYVKVEYFLDGERLHTWTDDFDLDFKNIDPAERYDISYATWNGWKKISASSPAIKFPNSVIEVFAKNFSSDTLTNPQLEIIFDNNGRVEKKILREKNIAPNQTIKFSVPLNQFRIDNPNYRIVNAVFDRITLNFSGDGAEIRGSNANVTFHFMQE